MKSQPETIPFATLAYADDIVVTGTRSEIEKGIEIIEDWCTTNGLTLNKSKSAIMRIRVNLNNAGKYLKPSISKNQGILE